MKKSTELLDLIIFSISEGCRLGVTKQLMIDNSKGEVVALVVDDGKWYKGAKILPFNLIRGIADKAMTVDSSSALTNVDHSPEYETLLENKVGIIGSKIITTLGQICGEVTEILIDEGSGKIAQCQAIDMSGNAFTLSTEAVVTFGRDVLVLKDENMTTFVPQSIPAEAPVQAIKVDEFAAETENPFPQQVHQSELPSIEDEQPPAAATITDTDNMQQTLEAAPTNYHTVAPAITEEIQPTETHEVPSMASATPSQNEITMNFDEKHRQFLLGKRASRKIETDSGLVIVNQDGEITEEVMQKARLAGKFIELTMSVVP